MQVGSLSPDNKPILSISIEVGDSPERQLEVRETDDPHQLAADFCAQYDVPEKFISIIEQNIILNVATIKSPDTNMEDIDENDEQIKPINSIITDLSEKQHHKNYLLGDKQANDSNDLANSDENWLFNRRVHSIDCTANIGEKLYNKGIRMKEKVEKNSISQKQKNEDIEKESLTFAPKINRTFTNCRHGKLEDQLIQYKYNALDKAQKEKERMLCQERSSCTFKPDINCESEKMAVERKKQISMEMNSHPNITEYDYLYEDSKRRQLNKNKLLLATKERECTFQPNREKTKHFQAKSQKQNKKSTVNKTYSDQREIGLFRPVTGRSPTKNRNVEGLPIGNYLYKQRSHKDEVVNNIKKLRDAIEQSNCRVELNDGTEYIYEKSKIDAFEEIFRTLDTDKDNKISTFLMDCKGIPKSSGLSYYVMKIISPILNGIQENELVIGKTEFMEMCNQLFKVCPLQDTQPIR